MRPIPCSSHFICVFPVIIRFPAVVPQIRCMIFRNLCFFSCQSVRPSFAFICFVFCFAGFFLCISGFSFVYQDSSFVCKGLVFSMPVSHYYSSLFQPLPQRMVALAFSFVLSGSFALSRFYLLYIIAAGCGQQHRNFSLVYMAIVMRVSIDLSFA